MFIPIDLYTYVAIIVLLLLLESWGASRRSRCLLDVLKGRGNMWWLNFKQAAGIAVCSLIFLTGDQSYLDAGNLISLPVILISGLAFGAGWFEGCLKARSSSMLPSVRLLPQSLGLYFLFRLSFLTLYEFFFRGELLNTLAVALNMPLSISINVLLYMLVHFKSNKKEMIASIPFGLLLCVVCIIEGSVWPAVIIHMMLAIGYEFKLLHSNYLMLKSPSL